MTACGLHYAACLAAPSTSVVSFTVDGIRLAIPAGDVQELVRAVAVTPLPGAPRDVLGVIDVRGDVLPVFELGHRFGGSPAAIRATDHLLVCTAGDRTVVVRADRVDRLEPIAPSDQLPVPADGDAWSSALARTPDGIVIICDLGRLLSSEDDESLTRALEIARGT